MSIQKQQNKIKDLQDKVVNLSNDLLKCQIIAASRLEVIRVLGMTMNRDPLPNMSMLPENSPNIKKIMMIELRNLVSHLRRQSDQLEKMLKVEEEKESEGKNDG